MAFARQGHRLETGATDLVDRHRPDRTRQSRVMRRLPGGRLPLSGRENTTHDSFVNLLGERAGHAQGRFARGRGRPLESRPHRHAAEPRRRNVRETALESPDGSSSSAKDHNLTHAFDDSRPDPASV